MNFFEQLCQLNDEDLPGIDWLENNLNDLKPDREAVYGFIETIESEIKKRKQRLLDLELELKRQHRRLDCFKEFKECLQTYASNKLPNEKLQPLQTQKPPVQPRKDSLKKQPSSSATPSPPSISNAPKPLDDESDYMKLSDCFSSLSPTPLKKSSLPEISPLPGSSTVRLRRPLENATTVQNSSLGRRHTFDEEKIHKRALERQAIAQHQNFHPVASNTSPTPPSTKQLSEISSFDYVNAGQFQVERSNNFMIPSTINQRDSTVSPNSLHSETALIDEQFRFLDSEITGSMTDLNTSGSNSDLTSNVSDNQSNSSKLAELRKGLVKGYLADQRDYLGTLETVVKYSLAIKTTLSMPKPDVISAQDFMTIFSLLSHIYEVEKSLVDKLAEMVDQVGENDVLFAPLIGDKYNERLALYAQYLRDYSFILETATKCLRESPKFNELCGSIIINERKLGKVKKRFEDVLLLPIVRLQSTGLALERIIEMTPPTHPDYPVLMALRKKLRSSLDTPNSFPALDNVLSGDKAGTLTGQKRQVLRPAVPLVEWITSSSTPRMATLTADCVRKLRYTFLFTDVFVACKRKLARNNRFQFEAVWWFQVSDMKLEDLPPAKVDQAVKAKLEELSNDILFIRRNLLAIARGGNTASAAAIQEQRKKLQQLEESWLITAPLVPLRLYNAGEKPLHHPGMISATTNDSKLLLFLSDFELGDWRRALHACQMRLMQASPPGTVSSNFSKDFLTLLCNEVAEKMGINNNNLNSQNHPHIQAALGQASSVAAHQANQHSPVLLRQDKLHGSNVNSSVASSQSNGVDYVPRLNDPIFSSMGHQQLSGQLMVTIHELVGLIAEKQCSIVLYVDCFGHFQIQAQTRLSEANKAPQWSEEFELDLNNSSTLRVVCYSREPDGRDAIVGQSALQLTADWLTKPFVFQPIGLLSANSADPHLTLTLTIRYRPPHMTIRRRHGLAPTAGRTSGTVFGQALGDLVIRDGNETAIPRIVTECVRRIEAADGLEQEGLYRISGLVGEVKRIKAAFDKDIAVAREQLHKCDVNVATGVLKSFFRELPDPLFTESLSQECLRLVAENQTETLNQNETLQQAAALFERLPKANRKTAFFLLQHLCRVADKSDRNLMTAENLARIWGPTLLAPPSGTGNAVSASTIYLQGQVLLIFLQLISSGFKLPDS